MATLHPPTLEEAITLRAPSRPFSANLQWPRFFQGPLGRLPQSSQPPGGALEGQAAGNQAGDGSQSLLRDQGQWSWRGLPRWMRKHRPPAGSLSPGIQEVRGSYSLPGVRPSHTVTLAGLLCFPHPLTGRPRPLRDCVFGGTAAVSWFPPLSRPSGS